MLTNNYSSLVKVLRTVVVIGCFLAVFTPLIIVPPSYFPYIIQKTLIFRSFIELLFFAYLVLALLRPEYRPKKSLILWSVLFFALVTIITTITSQSFARSLWGSWERMFGTFIYLHFFAWFIMVVSVFKTKKEWNLLLNFTLLCSLLVSLYAIAQRLGLPFTFEAGLKRVNSTLGNASYLATYLLLHIFMALLFFVERKKRSWKIYYLAIFIIDLFVLTLTGTRGALLALIAAVIVFIILCFWLKVWKQKTYKILLLICLLIFIGIGVLFIFKENDFVQSNYWFKRFTSFTPDDSTIQTRFRSWSWGLKGFRDHLIFGLGPENYQIAFNKYFTGDFYDFSRSEVWFDRAHNTLIDMASMMGIFGLLSYLFIFGAIFYYLIDFRKRQILSPPVFIILFLLFFSYFVQNIFVFDSLNSLIVFFLLLAFLSFIHFKNKPIAEEDNQQPQNKMIISPLISLPVSLAVFLVLFFTINLPEIKANILVFDAFVNGKFSKYEQSVNSYLKTYQVAVNKIDPAVLLSSSLNEMIGANMNIAPREKEIADLNTAVKWMEKAIALDPNNMFLYYLQAKNYALLVEISRDAKYLDKGIAAGEQSLALSPNNIRPLWILAQLYLFAGQYQPAMDYLNQAIASNSHLPETYYYLAVVYQNLGDSDKMYEQYDLLINNKYNFYSTAQVMEVLPHYEEKGDFDKVIYLIRQLTMLEPTDPNNWNNLINALEVAGRYDEALIYLQDWANNIPGSTGRAEERYYEILKKKNETTPQN